MGDHVFTVDRCPLCAGAHEYRIRVKRSVSVGFAPGGSAAPPQERTFTRIFTCPVRSAHFEASLMLTETVLDKIREIEVEDLP